MPRERRLPRAGHPLDFERQLAAGFANAFGLEAEFVRVRDRDDLIPALVEGRGDMVAATFTVTPEREASIAFSRPIGSVTEQLITRFSDTSLTDPERLAGRTLAVRRSSSYWENAERLARENPELKLQDVSERLNTEELLHLVERGELDITIADDNLVAQAMGYMPGLRVAFDVSDERPTAFGLRKDATELKAAVDSFLHAANLENRRPSRYTGDLSAIRERGVIRVLTRNSAATYFIWRGQLMGFEYDLARRFAESLGVRLEIVVPPTRADLLPWLEQGRGDLVAAGITTTREREVGGIAFSRPYNYVVETIVSRADEPRLSGAQDLAGRTVVVRRRSGYWVTAQSLVEQGIDLEIVHAPEDLETETIIDMVATGEYDLTIADSHILDVELSWRDDIVGAFAVGDTATHAWAVRQEDADLKDAIDAFFRSEYRGRWFNITYNKYFRTTHRILKRVGERPSQTGTISPYDDLFRRYAARFGFDWRLIAAQAYEESRFDPQAQSTVGATGILQVMPSTASALGIEDPEDPESGIYAGTQYLKNQYELFDDAELKEDRLWFALASYNAGYGHVEDARHLAPALGRDPNRWFGEVEVVMPLLARAEYHTRTRYGYCRCQEPVNYVRRIREKYRAYSRAIDVAEN
jgi:membrane-bound lytic murein transglycosylase F